MIYAVRSDETTHRFVNHSLANLERNDVNPFAFREPDLTIKGVKYGQVPLLTNSATHHVLTSFGRFEREEAAAYVQESRKILHEQDKAHS